MQRQLDLYEFKVSLVYRESSKIARVYRKTLFPPQKKQTNKVESCKENT